MFFIFPIVLICFVKNCVGFAGNSDSGVRYEGFHNTVNKLMIELTIYITLNV